MMNDQTSDQATIVDCECGCAYQFSPEKMMTEGIGLREAMRRSEEGGIGADGKKVWPKEAAK